MNRIMKYETLLLKNNQFFCIVKLNISCLYSAWMQRQYNDWMIFFLNSCNTIENSPFLSSLYSLFHLKCFANSRANRCKTLESLHVFFFFFWGRQLLRLAFIVFFLSRCTREVLSKSVTRTLPNELIMNEVSQLSGCVWFITFSWDEQSTGESINFIHYENCSWHVH